MPIQRKSLLRDMASEVVDASRGRGRKMEGDRSEVSEVSIQLLSLRRELLWER